MMTVLQYVPLLHHWTRHAVVDADSKRSVCGKEMWRTVGEDLAADRLHPIRNCKRCMLLTNKWVGIWEGKRSAKMRVDFGRMTEEETIDFVRDGIAYLTDDNLFEVLSAVLTREQKNELLERWGAVSTRDE